jgi:hypothetical protein
MGGEIESEGPIAAGWCEARETRLIMLLFYGEKSTANFPSNGK